MHLGGTATAVASLARAAGLGSASIVVTPLPGAPGSTGVTAESLEIACDPGAPIYPASMIKLPIAAGLARRVASGERRLEDRVVVGAGAMTANDAPSPFVPGYAATFGELGHAMLADSDNVATNVLVEALGRDALTADARALGLAGTAVRRLLSGSLPLIDDPAATGRNAHPASDAARLLGIVATDADGTYTWIADALRAQRWNDKLSGGWRADDAFAHKTGDTDECSHDGGILTLADGRRFVVVVYTTLPATPETGRRFAAFARALRPWFDEAIDRPSP